MFLEFYKAFVIYISVLVFVNIFLEGFILGEEVEE